VSEQSTQQPSATVAGVQKFIVAALAVTDEAKRIKAAEYIREFSDATPAEVNDKINELIGVNFNENDLNTLIAAFKKMSTKKKEFMAQMVKRGYTVDNTGFSKFRNVADKMNYIVTGDTKNDNGTKFIVTILKEFAINTFIDLTTVYDLNGNTKEIEFRLDASKDLKDFINSLMGDLLVYIEDLPSGVNGNSTVDDFLLRAQKSLNRLNVGSQIEEFKKYLEGQNKSIYDGKLNFVPTPTVVPSNPPSQPSYTTQPTATIPGAVETPTPTPTVTVTPTIKPTVAPTVAPNAKQITSFSFKGIADSKGVIFEKIHTIFVKVPVGTDLKKLEPVIEFSGASIKPEPGVKKNFNNPVFYTVTAWINQK
jgi:hypothetical protein